MERLSVKFDAKATKNCQIEGYASRFGEQDQGGDIVAKGAFEGSLARRGLPKMLWQHDASAPIGVWTDASEDSTGLHVRGQIMDTVEKGREAKSLVEAGAIDGLSIGYLTLSADRGEGGARILKEVDIWEVSLVTFPMLASARIDAIKASEMTEREFEALLTRDAGLSRTVARKLMSGGLNAVIGKQDAGDDGLNELLREMRAKIGKD